MSYRKKITGGYGNLLGKLTGKKDTSQKEENVKEIETQIDTKTIDEYENNLNASINVHKLADIVLTKEEFNTKISKQENDDVKQIYELSKNGDEDTIESLVGSFMLNFDFAYPVKANYELENEILYVDLDLPEIENLLNEYPTIVKNKIVSKKKTQSQLKQEYAYTCMSLSAYLSAQFFNLSSYIEQIVISGFTTKRDLKGDNVDEYLYSIKYTRDKFENRDLSSVDNIYNFILEFENRINLNNENYNFKSIIPYEMPSVEKTNTMIEECISGLKELGYKNALINQILPKLNEMNLQSSSEYLKEALKLLSSIK